MSSYLMICQQGSRSHGTCTTHSIWRVCAVDSHALEQEPHAAGRFALPIAECIHQLFQLRRSLDLEEDFVVVVRHFDVQVLAWLRRAAAAAATAAGSSSGAACAGVIWWRGGAVAVGHSFWFKTGQGVDQRLLLMALRLLL